MAHMTKEIEDCVEICGDCRKVCLSTVGHCLERGGKHAEGGHISLLLDCAEICQTSANFMSRGSEHHADVCGVCAEVCEACAGSCDAQGAEMKECAEICRRCAESCRQMAGVAAA